MLQHTQKKAKMWYKLECQDWKENFANKAWNC